MDIGKLKETVLVKTNAPATAGAGYTDSYSTLAEVKGYLKRKSGARVLSGGEFESDDSWELWIWYDSTVWTGLGMKCRVEIGSRVFTINAWQKIEEENRWIKFDL